MDTIQPDSVDAMKLPIDVVSPLVNPPVFRWQQKVYTIGGLRIVKHEGTLPPIVETAVAQLIKMAKQLIEENMALNDKLKGFAERIAAQSELLGKRAEPPQQSSVKGGKGNR